MTDTTPPSEPIVLNMAADPCVACDHDMADHDLTCLPCADKGLTCAFMDDLQRLAEKYRDVQRLPTILTPEDKDRVLRLLGRAGNAPSSEGSSRG